MCDNQCGDELQSAVSRHKAQPIHKLKTITNDFSSATHYVFKAFPLFLIFLPFFLPGKEIYNYICN